MIYQVLEGPPKDVERLWDQIRKDERHLVLEDSIRRRCIAAREFENWSMGLDEVDQTAWMAPRLTGFNQWAGQAQAY